MVGRTAGGAGCRGARSRPRRDAGSSRWGARGGSARCSAAGGGSAGDVRGRPHL